LERYYPEITVLLLQSVALSPSIAILLEPNILCILIKYIFNGGYDFILQ